MSQNGETNYFFKFKSVSQRSVALSITLPVANKFRNSIDLLVNELKDSSSQVRESNTSESKARSVISNSPPNLLLRQVMEDLDSF